MNFVVQALAAGNITDEFVDPGTVNTQVGLRKYSSNILEAESSSGGLGERQRGELDGEGSTLGDHRKNFMERSVRGI